MGRSIVLRFGLSGEHVGPGLKRLEAPPGSSFAKAERLAPLAGPPKSLGRPAERRASNAEAGFGTTELVHLSDRLLSHYWLYCVA